MVLSSFERGVLESIIVASENDPSKPEFPPNKPKFPATPTFKIEVPGFSNVWIKDESLNPTGTHKDRMSWEIVVTYRELLLEKERSKIDRPLPYMSIISSGSAALAIQTILAAYKLPNLKVLMDHATSKELIASLEKIGCEIYLTDLSKKALNWKEILLLTNNIGGIDITSNESMGPNTRFYDWLSYEVINNSPDYCFVPFGTGNLYENILNINKKEVAAKKHDPRFSGDISILRRCNFISATTNNPSSKATKLYSPHLPFVHFDEQWISNYIRAGYCGVDSTVLVVNENFIDKALELAKSQGIQCEPSGVAGLALLLQMRDKIPKSKKILIVNTGKTKNGD